MKLLKKRFIKLKVSFAYNFFFKKPNSININSMLQIEV